MEVHDGPRDQRLLLWRGGFEKHGSNFTVAVAEDLTPLLGTLWQFLWVAVGLSLLVQEIVRVHGGHLNFGRSEKLGGFASIIHLPGHQNQ